MSRRKHEQSLEGVYEVDASGDRAEGLTMYPYSTGERRFNSEHSSSIKAAVFGTSRSGKDYTINGAIRLLACKGLRFRHASPISMVNDALAGGKLSEMTMDERRNLIRSVREDIGNMIQSNGGGLFVDEHYSFPERHGGRIISNGYYGEKLPFTRAIGYEERGYEVVFEDGWMADYDLAVYLEIDPDVVLERFRTSEGDKNNPYITTEDIRLWQLFELDRIQTLCNGYNVPLYYIYDHERSGEELAMIVSHHMRYCVNNQNKNQKGIQEV